MKWNRDGNFFWAFVAKIILVSLSQSNNCVISSEITCWGNIAYNNVSEFVVGRCYYCDAVSLTWNKCRSKTNTQTKHWARNINRNHRNRLHFCNACSIIEYNMWKKACMFVFLNYLQDRCIYHWIINICMEWFVSWASWKITDKDDKVLEANEVLKIWLW